MFFICILLCLHFFSISDSNTRYLVALIPSPHCAAGTNTTLRSLRGVQKYAGCQTGGGGNDVVRSENSGVYRLLVATGIKPDHSGDTVGDN